MEGAPGKLLRINVWYSDATVRGRTHSEQEARGHGRWELTTKDGSGK